MTMTKNRSAVKGYEQAYQMGREAFHKGLICAPCNDKNYMAFAFSRTGKSATAEGFSRIDQLAEAWLGGWAIENLKAPIGGAA